MFASDFLSLYFASLFLYSQTALQISAEFKESSSVREEKKPCCPVINPFLALRSARLYRYDVGQCVNKCLSPPDGFNITINDDLRTTFVVDKLGDTVRNVPGAVFSRIFPISFKNSPSVVAVSIDALAAILNLSEEDTLCHWFAKLVGGQDSELVREPLAHRYGGHQFGEWSGQLGDGRAVLIGEYVNKNKERWELQLKGSGKTPYSRHGDGRAVVRSSVREFLASEAMHALGIPTSRAASLAISNDTVFRDQFYNGNVIKEKCAIVLRLAKSWFRIGSLEILQREKELDNLRKVADFMISSFHKDLIAKQGISYNEFFFRVVKETANLIAMWMSVGFTHGVCNTDNFSLLSITIDYGPFGFMEGYDPDFIPNTSDDTGLYRYSNQPEVGYFNLHKLMEAMSPLMDIKRAREDLVKYRDVYNARFLDLFSGKLGLIGREKDDLMLINSLLWLMGETKADFTMTFRELCDLSIAMMVKHDLPLESWALLSLVKHKHWRGWLSKYRARLQRQTEDTDEERKHRMQAMNPRYILRNYMAQIAIGKAEYGDYTEIKRLQRILSQPFTKQKEAEVQGYANPPPAWSKNLKVSCSS